MVILTSPAWNGKYVIDQNSNQNEHKNLNNNSTSNGNNDGKNGNKNTKDDKNNKNRDKNGYLHTKHAKATISFNRSIKINNAHFKFGSRYAIGLFS